MNDIFVFYGIKYDTQTKNYTMKKLFLLSLITMLCFSAFAVPGKEDPSNFCLASHIYISLSHSKVISLIDLSAIGVSDFQAITEKKLNLLQRFAFRNFQRKLRKQIKADGTINTAAAKYYSDGDHSTGFHVGGFLLGMTIIGVIPAYILPAADDDTKRNRVKWAWRGAAFTSTILSTIVLNSLQQ